jgi:carbonic anhydrase/acetyltransferase-like protein (isoleucine patch superfamily)
VQILTTVHPMNAELRRREECGELVEVRADVWVGGVALILAGVRIGSGTVIGAGSIVTVPDGVFAAGKPFGFAGVTPTRERWAVPSRVLASPWTGTLSGTATRSATQANDENVIFEAFLGAHRAFAVEVKECRQREAEFPTSRAY